MPNVTFILPDESEVTVEALAGDSLMQTAVDNGIEEITADCGARATPAIASLPQRGKAKSAQPMTWNKRY